MLHLDVLTTIKWILYKGNHFSSWRLQQAWAEGVNWYYYKNEINCGDVGNPKTFWDSCRFSFGLLLHKRRSIGSRFPVIVSLPPIFLANTSVVFTEHGCSCLCPLRTYLTQTARNSQWGSSLHSSVQKRTNWFQIFHAVLLWSRATARKLMLNEPECLSLT